MCKLALIGLLAVLSAAGQTFQGGIRGTVKDGSGGVLARSQS